MELNSTYKMPDGRLVTVDFTSTKSVMKVRKKDWAVIRAKLKEQLEFVQSPLYIKMLRKDIVDLFS